MAKKQDDQKKSGKGAPRKAGRRGTRRRTKRESSRPRRDATAFKRKKKNLVMKNRLTEKTAERVLMEKAPTPPGEWDA